MKEKNWIEKIIEEKARTIHDWGFPYVIEVAELNRIRQSMKRKISKLNSYSGTEGCGDFVSRQDVISIIKGESK